MMQPKNPLLLLLATAISHTTANDKVALANAQVEWVRSEGGYFSEKLRFQPLFPANSNSPLGIFTTEDISKGEKLMVLPQSCLLTSEGSYDTCDTVRNLIKQRKLGDKSKYAAYVNYLYDGTHTGQLPSSFSDKGKELIETIVDELPPYDVTGISFEDYCDGSGDPEEEEAYLQAVRRSWDDIFVPIYDMFNHRNGKWTGITTNSIHEGKDVTGIALRDIKAGEEVYNSYNECTDCDYRPDFHLTYVAPDMMKEFGFIEDFPRRWSFPSPVRRRKPINFELDQMPSSNDLHLTWLSGKPLEAEIAFLEDELERLQDLSDFVTEGVQQLSSSNEVYLVTEYYNALVSALEHAISAAGNEEEKRNVSSEL